MILTSAHEPGVKGVLNCTSPSKAMGPSPLQIIWPLWLEFTLGDEIQKGSSVERGAL